MTGLPLMPTAPNASPSSLTDFLASLTGPNAGPLPTTMAPGPMPTPAPGPLAGAVMPSLGTPAQPQPPAPTGGGGGGWQQILQQLMPAVFAAMAARQGGPAAAGAMLQGIAGAQAQARQLRQRQQEIELAQAATEDERQFKREQWGVEQRQNIARFQTEAMQTLATITDPGQYARTAQLYEQTGSQLFDLPPGWLEATPPEPDAQADAAKLVDQIRSTYGADGFERLVSTDATLSDGRKLSEILALAGIGATGPDGTSPFAPAQPAARPYTLNEYREDLFAEFREQQQREPTATERRALGGRARREWEAMPEEAKAEVAARHRQPERGVVMGPNSTLVDPTSGRVIARGETATDGAPAGGQSPYTRERSTRVLQSVDELLQKVGASTTGMGSLLTWIPGSAATDFEAELDTLKANIAFNELTQMREASKTGGALGAVSDRELSLLSSALGALNNRQSPANLARNLNRIKDSITRWQQAMSNASLGAGITTTGADPLGIR